MVTGRRLDRIHDDRQEARLWSMGRGRRLDVVPNGRGGRLDRLHGDRQKLEAIYSGKGTTFFLQFLHFKKKIICSLKNLKHM